MGKTTKKEYLLAIKNRYQQSSKKQKKNILDEFCIVCNYNRKYAIRLLTCNSTEIPIKKKLGRKKKYYEKEIVVVIKKIWQATNMICSKRLKAAIPDWLVHYPKPIDEQVRSKILSISASSIDRLFKSIRIKYNKKGLSTTKPGSLIKKQVPIKTNQWDETRPGFIEADTVAHCGSSIAGQFTYTVNTVDIASGWIESRAIWGKGEKNSLEAIISIENALPFKILGFDSDNGSEFLNWHMLKYFTKRKQPVQYTRSRAYQKNDNAHIEGKNWTHIRQYLGYHRFDNFNIVEKLNFLYMNSWSLFFNYFIPSSKLLKKERIGAKTLKILDKPKTPFQRLIDSEYISLETKRKLTKIQKSLDPFELEKDIRNQIINILKLI